jgi:hypothetical protein
MWSFSAGPIAEALHLVTACPSVEWPYYQMAGWSKFLAQDHKNLTRSFSFSLTSDRGLFWGLSCTM